MSAHTPGPWTAHVSKYLAFSTVAIGDVALEIKTECSEHDARLIAAATDMFAALESASDTLEQLVKINRIPANSKGLRDARAALAKAIGGGE